MDIVVLETKLQEVKDYIEHIEDSNPSWLDNGSDEYIHIQRPKPFTVFSLSKSWTIQN